MGGQHGSGKRHDVRLRLLSIAALEKRLREGVTAEEIHGDAARCFDTMMEVLSDAYDNETVVASVGVTLEELKATCLSVLDLLIGSGSPDPFITLCLPEGASEDEIRRRWKRLLQIFHPDRNPGTGDYEKKAKRINEAFDRVDKDHRGLPSPPMPDTSFPPPYRIRRTPIYVKAAVFVGVIAVTAGLVYVLVLKDFFSSGSKFKRLPPAVTARRQVIETKGGAPAGKGSAARREDVREERVDTGVQGPPPGEMKIGSLIDIAEVSEKRGEPSPGEHRRPSMEGQGEETAEPAVPSRSPAEGGPKETSLIASASGQEAREGALAVEASSGTGPDALGTSITGTTGGEVQGEEETIRPPDSRTTEKEPEAGETPMAAVTTVEQAAGHPIGSEPPDKVTDAGAGPPAHAGEVAAAEVQGRTAVTGAGDAGGPPGHRENDLDYDEVRAFIDRYVRLYEDGDLDGFMTLFSSDATENGVSISELEGKYRSIFHRAINRYELSNVTVKIMKGGVARIRGRYSIKRITPDDNRIYRFEGNITWILKKMKGGIEIIDLRYD